MVGTMTDFLALDLDDDADLDAAVALEREGVRRWLAGQQLRVIRARQKHEEAMATAAGAIEEMEGAGVGVTRRGVSEWLRRRDGVSVRNEAINDALVASRGRLRRT
jgi:hypothetical protein